MEQKYRLDQDNYLLRSASGEIEDFTNSPSFIIYNKIKKRLATDAALLNKLKFDPTFLHLNLKEISLLTPETINLRSYQVENTGQKYFLNLEGSVVSSSVPPEVALAEYIARLEGSPFFTDVKLIKYLKKSEDQHFVLDFAIQSSAIL